MAYKINEDLYVGNTNKQLKDLFVSVHDAYTQSSSDTYSCNYLNKSAITVHDAYSTSTTDTYSCNYMNKARLEEYSTTEKIIGRWYDGKPLYQKVILYTGGISSTINNRHAHGIKNVDTIFIKNAFVQSTQPNKLAYMLPVVQYGSNTTHDELSVCIDTTHYQFLVQTGWAGENWHAHIIVNYTKTTD